MSYPKTYEAFLETLKDACPPNHWSEALQSLWYDAKGNWEASHNIAQDIPNTTGHWIHAYLHRKEGDAWNAGYWYRRADRPFPKMDLEEEHRAIVRWLLEN
ncbi:hypothetical protein WIW50_13735 [Flavobacteriaceae bacterium 3-367]|uniref:hypothetical protein n=1 Tax=Eudoraea algarum TaxID=3417568 RepID=UPI00328D0EC1